MIKNVVQGIRKRKQTITRMSLFHSPSSYLELSLFIDDLDIVMRNIDCSYCYGEEN